LLAAIVLPIAFLGAPTGDPTYRWLLAGVVVVLIIYNLLLPRAKAAGAFVDVVRSEVVGALAIAIAIGVLILLRTTRGVNYETVVLFEVGATLMSVFWLASGKRARFRGVEMRTQGTAIVLPSVYSVGLLVLLDLLIWRRLEIYFLQASPDGLAGVAVFGLASQLAALFLLVPTAMVDAWSPALAVAFRGQGEGFAVMLRTNRRQYTRVFILICLVAVLATPVGVAVAFPKYLPWLWYLSAFVVIRVLCSVSGFYSAVLYATKRERLLYAPTLIGGTVGLLSNAVLTLRWGLPGAVVAYGLTQVTVAVSTLFAFRQAGQLAA
jgi:O-antigen/teichoic acid export membrane protein